MQTVIEISDYDKEWIANGYHIPEEINMKISEAIINGTPFPKEQRMTLTEFMDERYKNRKDKDNIFGVGVSDAEFRTFIIDYLLGEDWYVVDPLGQTQVNEIALAEILSKYSKRFKKEIKPERYIRRWE